MRLWAVILLALTGCWSTSDDREVRVAEVAVEPTVATSKAQAVATKALDKALEKPADSAALATVLKAIDGVSKVAIQEGKAKSAQLDVANTVNQVTKVAAVGLALSFLAFLFGSYVGIHKLAAVASAALCLSVAVAAPALLQALGTSAAQWVILSCFGILAVSAAVSLAWLAIDKARDMARRSR